MEQIIEGYGFGIIQDCDGLFQTLKKKGFSLDDFLVFVEEIKKKKGEEIDKFVEKIKPKEEPKVDQEVKHKFMVPGELEIMKGVLCSKCKSEVYTTVVCCSNPLKKQGFLRKTICSSCGAENGQR